jgi:hypothetical protein
MTAGTPLATKGVASSFDADADHIVVVIGGVIRRVLLSTLIETEAPTVVIGSLIGANMNTTADQAIPLTLPAGCTDFSTLAIRVSNPSISLTTAVGGIYSATAKGGIAIGNGAQTYSALSATGPNAAGSLMNMGLNTAYYRPSLFATPNTVYLTLTTAQGAPATCDFRIFAQCW